MLKLIQMLCYLCLMNLSYAAEFKTLPEVGSVSLKPQMRAQPATRALYTVKSEDLVPYLDNLIILDNKDTFENLPYILSFDNSRTMGVVDENIYVMGLKDDDISSYSLINLGKTLIDPQTKKSIGIQAYVVGDAEIVQPGEPATLVITRSLFNADIGTKLIPRIGLDLPEIIEATMPQKIMQGYIVAVQNDNEAVGNGSVITINLGKNDGVDIGNLFNLLEHVRYVKDPKTGKNIQLPTETFGEILVYQVYDKFSLAIVTKATRPAEINDAVYSKTEDN